MKKENKSIGLTSTTQTNLQLQAISRKVNYKLHCEEIMEKAGKMSPEDISEWLGVKSKPVSNKPKPSNTKIPKNVSAVEKDENEFNEMPESSPTHPKHFDTSGHFKRVKDMNKIYTNGKCFEFRDFSIEEGMTKYYYETLEEAVSARDNK